MPARLNHHRAIQSREVDENARTNGRSPRRFTTFSTFSMDVVTMIEAEQFAKAAAYVGVNNVGSVGAALGSYKLAKGLYPKLGKR